MSTNKIPFKSAYDLRNSEAEPTPSGERMRAEYAYEINNFGQKELVKVGETDFYAYIQESLEETKIENILNRVAMGDNTVLRPEGIYADISTAPQSLLEARQQVQKLENLWNSLPIDTKREYDMSVEKFINDSGSDKWLKTMGLIPSESETTKQIETSKPSKTETTNTESEVK